MPKRSTKEERTTLQKVEDYFTSVIDDPSHVEWRDEIALPCFKYKEGDQWPDSEKAELKRRNQPETVNNQVNVTINRLVGQFVKSRTKTQFKPRNANVDQGIADVLNDLYLYIAQSNELEFEERDMLEEGVTSGVGWLEIFVEHDEAFQPEIKIRAVDNFEVFLDPTSRRYDPNDDATFICRAKWMDTEEAARMFPDKASQIRRTTSDATRGLLGSVDTFRNLSEFFDTKRNRIRLIECQYKTHVVERKFLFSNGTVLEKEDATDAVLKSASKAGLSWEEVSRPTTVLRTAVFAHGILLEDTKSVRNRFAYVPYYVSRKKNGAPYSLIFIALSMQDAINKRESKALHLLNTNQAIYEQGAVEDKGELANEMARPDGQIELARGHAEKFRLEKNTDLAVTQMNFHNAALSAFRMITGVNPDALGEKSEVRSGLGIARKVAMTDLIVASIFDNLRRTRVTLAKSVLDAVQAFYTEEKIFTITDNVNAPREVRLDNNSLEAIKQTQFDIVISEMPDFETVQEQQFATLGQLLPQILPYGPFWARIMLQMSNLRDKEALLKQLDNVPPPPNDPKISISAQIDMLSPEERAFLYMKMGAPQVAQAVLQNQIPPTNVMKEQGEMRRNAGKIAETQLKNQGIALKAQGDLTKAQLDIEEKRLDVQRKSLDLADKIAKQED